MKKVAIHSLGCKVNSYEAESMEIMLRDEGYEIVPFSEDVQADIYIINTCSVTNIADRKSRQMLHKAKKMNPEAVVVAAGCYVQADPDGVKKDECVDIVLGNNMKINIVEALNDYFGGSDKTSYLVDINDKYQEYESLKINQTGEHTRAYIKIQDGCNQFCSYCIIPYVRGRVRSRKPQDIVNEVKTLAATGVKEVVLTGIHISSYGTDLENISLIELIEAIHEVEGIKRIRLGSLEPRIITEEFAKRIAQLLQEIEKVDGIERIRFMTSHPKDLSDDLIEVMKNSKKICKHLHLPLQSGSSRILKLMNRRYDKEHYLELVDKIRAAVPDIALTTDIIVGFPGETEEDFEETMDVVRKVRYDSAFTFIYSKRTGTPAAVMEDQIPEDVIKARFDRLLKEVQTISAEKAGALTGQTLPVLIEEKNEQDASLVTGRLSNNSVVHLPGTEDMIGKIVDVKLLECKGFYYMGESI